MKIYLIRHGETEWNKECRLQGQTDIELNEYGRELAAITSEALKDIPFEIIFHSPLNRAEETARILKRDRNIPMVADNRIKEMNFGVEEGGHIPTIQKHPQNPLYKFLNCPGEYIPPKEGETFEEVYNRSSEFMEKEIIPLESKYENVLIVAHGGLNRTILNPIAGIAVSDFWKIRLKNCAVSVINLKNGKLTLEQEGSIYYESKNKDKSILN